MTARDLPLLHEWLQRPHVAAWWTPTPSYAELVAEFTPMLTGQEQVSPFIILLGDEPIGYIQAYVAMGSGGGWWPNERDPGVRGIDQFLSNAEQLGRGIGTAVVRAFVRQLFDDPAVTRVQVDPSPENARAIRCYEKAGFVRVGEVQTPDGRALLMSCDRVQLSVEVHQ